MSIGAFGLSTNTLVCLALLQSGTQGILITLLLNFLASESSRPTWFKNYVILVNVLSAGQTVIHVMQAFEGINSVPPQTELVLVIPILTGLISAFVQPFFMYRCWRIYQQRSVLVIPLVLLWATTLICAVLMGVYLSFSSPRPPGVAIREVEISNAVWSFSSLLFDLITTLTTIIYLFRIRKDLTANQNALLVVWQVLWGSAVPPLILIAITIVDGYMISSSPRLVGIVAVGMMGKVFVLSLMVNIVGQGHIRRQFERRYTSFSSPTAIWRQRETSQTHQPDWPPMQVTTAHVQTFELTTVMPEPVSRCTKHEDPTKGNSGKSLSDTLSPM